MNSIQELIEKYDKAISDDRELITFNGQIITVEYAEYLIQTYKRTRDPEQDEGVMSLA